MKITRLIIFFSISLALLSCKKEDDDSTTDVPKADLSITVLNEVDGEALVFNNLSEKKYANKAGNVWEVRRLEYYLSKFEFQKSNGQWISVFSMPELINAENGTNSFTLVGVPIGSYTGLRFMVGIPDNQNKTGYLENNLANLNMAWPENLNGGYHHMKFEGNYLDLDNEIVGFTVHLGDIGNQAVNTFENLNLPIVTGGSSITLTMNPNEWFENPYTYDFNVDGNYTMAVYELMEIISKNGQNCMSLNVPL